MKDFFAYIGFMVSIGMGIICLWCIWVVAREKWQEYRNKKAIAKGNYDQAEVYDGE